MFLPRTGQFLGLNPTSNPNTVAPSTVVSSGGALVRTSAQNYLSAFTPGQPNFLAGDAGISQIVDPLANVEQVPVVTDTIEVQKTSPWVMISIAALAFFMITKGKF